MNKYTKHHFELYMCKHGMGGGFLTSLYHAMGRADHHNLLKFKVGFPEEYNAYMDWYTSSSEAHFFQAVKEQLGIK